jgi:hypothetical protein
MCWSSAKNSAVSSSIDFEGGLGGKGITSDIGRTSLGVHTALPTVLPGNWRISAAEYAARRSGRRRWFAITHDPD